MPQSLKTKGHTPKVVRINGDDNMTIIYRNLGNGRRVPFLIGLNVTVASGTTSGTLGGILSGLDIHGYKISSAIVQATLLDDLAVGRYWIEKDTVNNNLILHQENTPNAAHDYAHYDVYVFLGDAAPATLYDSTSSNQIWS